MPPYTARSACLPTAQLPHARERCAAPRTAAWSPQASYTRGRMLCTSLRILEELELKLCVCRCKSCIIRVKVSDGRTLCPINFVPYLSGNGKSSPLSMLCTQNRLLEFLKCSASTGSSYHGVGIIIKERGNWFFFHPNLHFKTWLMFKKDLDGFKHLWTWKTILFFWFV